MLFGLYFIPESLLQSPPFLFPFAEGQGRGLIFALMKKALLQLHIAVFLAGFTAILGKLITLNEGLLVWYRLLITVATLFVLLYFKKQLVKISAGDALRFLGVGAIVALHWVTFYGSVKYANVSVALVCFSATGFLLREKESSGRGSRS